MDASSWIDWLVAADEEDCHGKLGPAWEDGCCRIRRGRSVKFRLTLWLSFAELGYWSWQELAFAMQPPGHTSELAL
jgi:hypothetical protein